MSAHDALPAQFCRMMTASPAEKISGWPAWLAAALVTLATFGLHVFFLFHAGGFWRDEVNVINLAASHSPAFMARDSFPILLPVLIKVWSALGLAGCDFNLRCLGSLIGLGLPGTLWLAAWTARRAPPILSLILLGLNSEAIFWGDSLRAYGLGSLLIVFALVAMCFLLQKPNWRRTGILAVAAILCVQALYQNAVLFASIGLGGWLVCWLRKDTRTALKIFVAGLVACCSLLPYLGGVANWSRSAAVIRPGFSMTAVVGNFTTVTAFPLPQYVWLWTLLVLVVIGLGIAVLFRQLPQSNQRPAGLSLTELQLFAGGTLFAAFAGYFCFLHFAALITEPWYFLPLVALAAGCFELAIALPALPRWWRTVTTAILFATAAIALPFAARDLNCRFTNVDLVANALTEKISPPDYVVVTPWYLGISFERYYHGAAAWDTLPPVADHSTHRFDLAQTALADHRTSQAVLDRIATTLQAGHRVWIVGWMSVPAPGRTAATEAGRFLAEHSQSFAALDVKTPGRICDFEEISLLLASGWRTNQP